MAKVVYVDKENGDNGNDGLSWVNAKSTILGARAATVSGDLVLIKPNTYLEADVTWSSSNDDLVVYMPDPDSAGLVIVDFQNVDIAQHWYFNPGNPIFVNILFRNPGTATTTYFFQNRTTTRPLFYHCVFANEYGTNGARVMHGSGSFSQRMLAINCTFYNLYEGAGIAGEGPVYNCYFVDVTTPISGGGVHDYNAYSGNAEANGIDTDSVDPGLRSPSTVDYRLDPNTTPSDFDTFMTSGLSGDRIGAFGKGGLYYNSSIPSLRFLSADPSPASGNPLPSWINEGPNGSNTYTTGTPGDIIENASTYELEIDLATTPGATGGRVLSPVFDLGTAITNLDNIAYSSFEDLGGGAAIDTDTSLPQKIEYRSSDSSFTTYAGSPSWTEVTKGDDINVAHRYIQVRIEFQTGHSGS